MTTKFKKGDHVRWNSEAGEIKGVVAKVHTEETTFKGRKRHASKDEPQYEVESDKTGNAAMHKEDALRKA